MNLKFLWAPSGKGFFFRPPGGSPSSSVRRPEEPISAVGRDLEHVLHQTSRDFVILILDCLSMILRGCHWIARFGSQSGFQLYPISARISQMIIRPDSAVAQRFEIGHGERCQVSHCFLPIRVISAHQLMA